jgi:hypothetical protein
MFGQIVVMLLGGLAVKLSKETIQLTGLVPLATSKFGSDDVDCPKLKSILAQVPEKNANMEGLEHEPSRSVGESAGSEECENKTALVDLNVAASQLRVKGNAPGLDTSGFLLLSQTGDCLITMNSNCISEAELESLQDESCRLEEEIVTRDPYGLDSGKPSLSADMNW